MFIYNNIIARKQTNNINFISNNNEDNKNNVKITKSEFWTSLISDIEIYKNYGYPY